MTAFDWRNPDYSSIYAQRAAALQRIRQQPQILPSVRAYYAEPAHAADFLCDFGMVFEPRNAERGLPTTVPFILFGRQREWISWVLDLWQKGQPGIIEKSRDCGVSTLAMALSCWMCLFYPGMAIGVGSAKESKIDNGFNPDSLFFKARLFMQHLPPEFRGGFDPQRHSAHMRLRFPDSGSSLTGEAGDNIGRGGRKAVYWIDESAHLERPKLIENSLASNTNCRQDISSVAGLANPFAERRHGGRISVFTFSWRADPRKGPAWYEQQQKLLDPVSLAQEVDLDYFASTEGALIPSAWVQAAVGALERLGIKPSGDRRAALDVADEGRDRCAFAARHGQQLQFLKSWSGKSRDIFSSVQQCFLYCDQLGYRSFRYDSDGLGAGCRGDSRIVNEQRKTQGLRWIDDVAYRGSAPPLDPDGEMTPGRKNQDFFANLKAQSWWSLRQHFQATHRAIAEDGVIDADELISLAPDLEELPQLLQELTQVSYSINGAGKVVIDKAPSGFKSPNLADAVCMCFAPSNVGAFFPESALLARVP